MARQRLTIKTSEPIPPDRLKKLNDLLRMCAESGAYCEKCESCGIDVTPEKRENLEQQRSATRIKEQFFPGAP